MTDRPRAADDSRVYAVGDVHGRADLLVRLFDQIAADIDQRAGDGLTPRLVMLGDYVDRGPDSRGVLDLLTGPPPVAGLARTFLKGNHEDMMLRALRDPDDAGAAGDGDLWPLWLANGGRETLASYGLGPEDGPGGLAAVLPPAHRRFLEGLELAYASGDYLFVHAGIRPGRPLERQDPQTLMWIREPFLSTPLADGPLVVHGHTIRDAPEVRRHRIGIDTGAYASGILTCLVVAGAERRFLST